MRNVGGPSAADGTTVDVEIGRYLFLKDIKCAAASGAGSSCAGVSIAAGKLTIAKFPVGASYDFTVSMMPVSVGLNNTESGQLKASVTPPAGTTDTALKSNVAEQAVVVRWRPSANVNVTSSAPESVGYGKEVVRTFTLSNDGVATKGSFGFSSGYTDNVAPATVTLRCIKASKVSCPATSHVGTLGTSFVFDSLPSGATAVFEGTITYERSQCSVNNQAQTYASAGFTPDGFVLNKGSGSGNTQVTITDITPCKEAHLTTKLIAPTSFAAGQRGELSFVYTNSGPDPVPVNLLASTYETYPHFTQADPKVTCSVADAGACSDFVITPGKTTIPAGGSVTATYSFVPQRDACTSETLRIRPRGFVTPVDPNEFINVEKDYVAEGYIPITGFKECIPVNLAVSTEYGDAVWVGEQAWFQQTFTNNDPVERLVSITDRADESQSSWLDVSPQTVVTCVSDVCPAEYPKDQAVQVKDNFGLLDGSSSFTLPAGGSVVLKKQLTIRNAGRCAQDGHAYIASQVKFMPAAPDTSGQAIVYATPAFNCKNDSLALSLKNSAPGVSTTLMAAVGNLAGAPRTQHVSIALPDGGIFFGGTKPATTRAAAPLPTCTRSGANVACPALEYNAATREISFDLTDTPSTSLTEVSIPVSIGVKPSVGGASYTAVGTVSSTPGEIDAAANRSTVSVGINNELVASALKVSADGAPLGSDVEVHGVMGCQFQPDIEFTGVLKAGKNSVTLAGTKLYPGDHCSLALDDLTGKTWASGQVQPERTIDGPVLWEASVAEPSVDADSSSNANAASNADANAGAGSDANASAGADVNANADANAGSGANADAGAGADVKAEANANAGDGADANAGSDADANAGSNANGDAAANGTTPPPSPHPLPETGSNSGTLIAWAAGAVLVGAVLWFGVARRPGSHRD